MDGDLVTPTGTWTRELDNWIYRDGAGRYSGWVQPGEFTSPDLRGMWVANWRLPGLTDNRLWAWPLGEEPGHLHRSLEEAIAEVERRSTGMRERKEPYE